MAGVNEVQDGWNNDSNCPWRTSGVNGISPITRKLIIESNVPLSDERGWKRKTALGYVAGNRDGREAKYLSW
jgi:hypothetical protein